MKSAGMNMRGRLFRISVVAALGRCAACGLAALIALSSCARRPPAAQRQPVVGVTLLTRSHQFYQDLESAMRKTAADVGIQLRVQSADFKVDKQTNQVEDFINSGADAIVICPADSRAIVGAVKRANQAGIPVFTADITALGGDVVSHIASDNVQGGRLIGERLAKLLNGKGKVVIIDHPVTTSVQDRVRGFQQALAQHPGISIVARPTAEGQRTKAVEVAETMLEAHPDLGAFFGINDDSALGALQAVKQAGRADRVIVVGYDATPEARQEILAGSALKADAVQYPRKIGQVTIETVAKYLRGESVPKVIPVEVGIVDRESLQSRADSKSAPPRSPGA
jgi:ribose transport system substrate-binding protein